MVSDNSKFFDSTTKLSKLRELCSRIEFRSYDSPEENRIKKMANTTEEIKSIVLARIMAMPDSIRISIGGKGEFDKKNMIKHVREGDETGKKLIEMHLFYLRSLKERYA